MNEQEFWAALAPLPEPVKPSYRLYYDELGLPLFYSMEDVPGNYIEIDCETYNRSPINIRIVNGALVYLKTCVVSKLHPSEFGTPCHPDDITIVVSEDEPNIKWSLK